jgi:predicted DNA-binding transcriptional regulator YafY
VSGRGAGGRLARLDELRGLLAGRDFWTAEELAAELSVSVRTLHRDLAVLRDGGVPIDSDRGRGGGLSLAAGWSAGRVHLNESEAIGLLLSLTIAEQVGSPLLLDDLRSIRRKLAASFAPAGARRILALRRRILVGSTASARVMAGVERPSQAAMRPLLTAFAQRRVAQIEYRDGAGTRTRRPIEAQYLYYAMPVWYVVAWDHLRGDVRSFRIDRIVSAMLLDDEFRLRRPEPFFAAGEASARHL